MVVSTKPTAALNCNGSVSARSLVGEGWLKNQPRRAWPARSQAGPGNATLVSARTYGRDDTSKCFPCFDCGKTGACSGCWSVYAYGRDPLRCSPSLTAVIDLTAVPLSEQGSGRSPKEKDKAIHRGCMRSPTLHLLPFPSLTIAIPIASTSLRSWSHPGC
jgi:hypothetical protein